MFWYLKLLHCYCDTTFPDSIWSLSSAAFFNKKCQLWHLKIEVSTNCRISLHNHTISNAHVRTVHFQDHFCTTPYIYHFKKMKPLRELHATQFPLRCLLKQGRRKHHCLIFWILLWKRYNFAKASSFSVSILLYICVIVSLYLDAAEWITPIMPPSPLHK